VGGVPSKRGEKYVLIRQVGLLTAVPFVLAVAPLIGFFAGRFLDQKLGTDPWLMIILIVLGFVAGARQVYRLVRLASTEVDREQDQDSD
jgi:F0F1-type ATP synthase assembly protein I